MTNNKLNLTDLNLSEIRSINGGHPVVAVYAAATALYAVALEAMKSKGYSDGKKSAHCN
jgi:hypothetical protein